MTPQIQAASFEGNAPQNAEITPVDVARAAGLDPNTTRRYLKDENPVTWKRTRKKWHASELPRLIEICESKRQRRCFNKFNTGVYFVNRVSFSFAKADSDVIFITRNHFFRIANKKSDDRIEMGANETEDDS